MWLCSQTGKVIDFVIHNLNIAGLASGNKGPLFEAMTGRMASIRWFYRIFLSCKVNAMRSMHNFIERVQ
jgi:hypothetical protein